MSKKNKRNQQKRPQTVAAGQRSSAPQAAASSEPGNSITESSVLENVAVEAPVSEPSLEAAIPENEAAEAVVTENAVPGTTVSESPADEAAAPEESVGEAQEPSVSEQPEKQAVQPNFYIQYQGEEYLASELTCKVVEKCVNDGFTQSDLETLSIYLKPEDKKAYYACEKGTGSIDL